MRFKVGMALALALVLLFTVATPALAGAPGKGHFTSYAPADVAKYSLQATHDYDIKVTVVLRGATPNTKYEVSLDYGSDTPTDGNAFIGDFTTDGKGNIRYVVKDTGWSPGTLNYQLKLLEDPYGLTNLAFVGDIETLTFK